MGFFFGSGGGILFSVIGFFFCGVAISVVMSCCENSHAMNSQKVNPSLSMMAFKGNVALLSISETGPKEERWTR